MCDTSNVTVGTVVIVKVGRNEIEVEVTEITPTGWRVRKPGSDSEFTVTRIERIVDDSETAGAEEIEPMAAEAETDNVAETATEPEDDTPNPAPEAEPRPVKKRSLMEAGLEVLKNHREPLNSKEIIEIVLREGLWESSGSKTPHQSLYASFFTEIKNNPNPRVRKSTTRKGSFEYNG